jgi:hypothetical protein
MKKARNGATTPTEKEKNDAAIKAQKEKRAAIQADYDKKKKEAMDKRKASLTIPASNPASVKAKEEARAKEAAKNKAATDAQKQKRESIQKDYDRKKEEAMAKRRAAGLPASPAPAKSEGNKATPGKARTDAAGMQYAGRQVASYLNEKDKNTGRRAPVRKASVAVPAAKRNISSVGVSKPSAPGIQKGPEKRSYSSTESKINAELQKMKSGKNTEAAQMRIKALKAKESAQKMKAAKKQVRVEKKSNKASQKSTVKMSKK